MSEKKTHLILVSFLGLFLELGLIRWIPAHIFSIAFFSNVILIAAFLGLGLGFLFSDNKRDLFKFFAPILTAFVLLVLLLKNIGVALPANAQTWIWSYYNGNRLGDIWPLKIPIELLIAFIFILTGFVFIPIGQKIGRLMREFKPLYAYTLNVLGSLLGVISFGLLSIFNVPAFGWFMVTGIMLILVTRREKNFVTNLLLALAVVFMIWMQEADVSWSPYYAINTKEVDNKSIAVYVNQLFHQKAVNFEAEPHAYRKYMLPYRIFSPKRVLIIGSGTGNDVWIARESGASEIDAVEIDPVILKMGRDRHPQRPYDSGKVRVFVDDARSFMHRSSGGYDMIVYGTLDSHATLSVTSSIRLDNYVYTEEALREARNLLDPDGVIVLLFSVPTDWMMAKICKTVRSAFNAEDARFVMMDNYLFNLMIVAGPGVNKHLSANPKLSGIFKALPETQDLAVPKDDWPYLYLTSRGIPRLYLISLGILIFLSAMAVFGLSPLRRNRIDPLFFLMGCGFLLLETKSVTTFSLLFGSTWLINAVVFCAILGIALLANWLVMARSINRPQNFIIGIILSLLFVYFLPITPILKLNFLPRIFASGMLIALPILFSSVAFAVIFSAAKNPGIAMGSNLLGAVIGGFLEYTSMIFGLNTLYLIAAICYGFAFLVSNRLRS